MGCSNEGVQKDLCANRETSSSWGRESKCERGEPNPLKVPRNYHFVTYSVLLSISDRTAANAPNLGKKWGQSQGLYVCDGKCSSRSEASG